MELLISNLPLAISAVLIAVLVLSVVTNIIVEVLKKAVGNVPLNLMALAVAVIITVLSVLAAFSILEIELTWYFVVGSAVLGLFVAYSSMFGYDKFKQTIAQIPNAVDKQSGKKDST